MKKKVSVIVLNHNGLSFLKDCLKSIRGQTYPKIEVIVTDNDSTDGSVEYVKKQRAVKLLAHGENFGYTKANNLAAKKASGEFLLFMNNDTKLYPEMIEELVGHYQEKTVLCPAQVQRVKGKELVRAAVGMDVFGYPYVDPDPRKTKPFYVDGAGIFVKRKDFNKIKGFDDELFIFQEDIDFSWRAQIFGLKVKSCWSAKFEHYGGGTVLGGGPKEKKYESSYFRRYLNEKNVIRNILKNYSFPFFPVILLVLLLLHLVEIIFLVILREWKVVGCYFKAYVWNIKNIKNTLRFRKFVQSRRKVSDLVLLRRMYWSYSKLYSFIKLGVPRFKN